MVTYTDTSIMPFGQHKGKAMANIPDSYLLWLYNQGTISHEGVRRYIDANLDSINKAASKAQKVRR